jgi:hypothetical protein
MQPCRDPTTAYVRLEDAARVVEEGTMEEGTPENAMTMTMGNPPLRGLLQGEKSMHRANIVILKDLRPIKRRSRVTLKARVVRRCL